MESLDCLDLLARKLPPLALRQLAQPHGTVCNAMQPLHLEPERLGDAAHDALPPFGDRQLDFDRPADGAYARLHDPDGATLDHDPLRQSGPDRRDFGAVYAEPIGARYLVPRVREPVSRCAIRRQEQQARSHDIQPSNVRETRDLGEKAEYGAPPLRIGAADDVADGLIERDPGGAGGAADGTAVHRDALRVGIDAHADRRLLAIDTHAARADQILRFAARRDARARHGALQAHQGHSGSSTGVGRRRATDSSSSRGRSSRSFSPRISRNEGVVP